MSLSMCEVYFEKMLYIFTIPIEKTGNNNIWKLIMSF